MPSYTQTATATSSYGNVISLVATAFWHACAQPRTTSPCCHWCSYTADHHFISDGTCSGGCIHCQPPPVLIPVQYDTVSPRIVLDRAQPAGLCCDASCGTNVFTAAAWVSARLGSACCTCPAMHIWGHALLTHVLWHQLPSCQLPIFKLHHLIDVMWMPPHVICLHAHIWPSQIGPGHSCGVLAVDHNTALEQVKGKASDCRAFPSSPVTAL